MTALYTHTSCSVNLRKLHDFREYRFTLARICPLQVFSSRFSTQQFARVYIPLRRRVTASIPGLRVLVHSNPTAPIVSRLRKTVLSRIIRLHRIIAYTGRDRRAAAAAARLHLFRPGAFSSKRDATPIERLIHSTTVSRAWLEINQIFERGADTSPRNVTRFSFDGLWSLWFVNVSFSSVFFFFFCCCLLDSFVGYFFVYER